MCSSAKMASPVEAFTPQNYNKKSGKLNLGRDYELRASILLYLRCMSEPSTLHSWFAMNVDHCGPFANLVLYRKTIGNELVYLIRLHHAEKDSGIGLNDFLTKRKRPFFLQKYLDAVPPITTNENLNLLFNDAKIVFVLFTNRGVTDACDFLQEIPKRCDLDRKWLLYETLDTSLNGNIFEFANIAEFFLVTKQLHVDCMDGAIANAIKNLIQPVKVSKQVLNDLVMKFIAFILEWSKGRVGGYFPMTKRVIMKKLLELLLEPYTIEHNYEEEKFDTSLWRKLVSDKEVVVINKPDEEVLKYLQEYISVTIGDYKNASGRDKVSREDVYAMLWKNQEIPVILKVNKAAKKQIESIIKISKGLFKFILLLDHDQKVKLNFPAVFETFNDLKEEHQREILKNPVKLQGKKSSLHLTDDGTINLSVKDIIHILIGSFNVGGEFEPLPNFFLDINLQFAHLCPTILKEIKECIAIEYQSEASLEMFLQKNNIKIFRLNPNRNIIILSDDKATINHFLMLNASNELTWIDSFGSVKNIRHYRKDSGTVTVTAKEFIASTAFRKKYLVSANPGMGKTILLRYIALGVPNSWVVKINLAEHKAVFKTWNGSCNLEIFLNNNHSALDKIIFQHYLESQNILFLLDAFDEVPITCQEGAKKFIKFIDDSNFPLIVTTRPCTKQQLEYLLDTLAIDLCPFTRTQQESYLTKYFDKFTDVNMDVTVEFVRELLKASKENFTEVPLHALLLAEVFEKDYLKFVECRAFHIQHFDLLYLYQNFMEKKARIACDKIESISDDMIGQFKMIRTLHALKLLFTEEDLAPFKITETLEDGLKTLPNLTQLIQKDGIVVSEDETHLNFVHYTFAEYLVAVWLAENINQGILQPLIEKIFHPSFIVVRNIFDQLICENCPLHLAIINRKIDVVENLLTAFDLNCKDRCGRNILHIVSSWGLHHPVNCTDKRQPAILRRGKDMMIAILNLIPAKKLFTETDRLLHYTPWDYTLISGSLNVANAICTIVKNPIPAIKPERIDLNYCEAYCGILNYLPLHRFLQRYCGLNKI